MRCGRELSANQMSHFVIYKVELLQGMVAWWHAITVSIIYKAEAGNCLHQGM